MTKLEPRDGKQLKRLDVPMFDGINTLVGETLAKKTEVSFIENARSEKIGWLTKRAGYSIFGNVLQATANWGLYDFVNSEHHFLRVSTVSGTTSLYLYSNGTWVKFDGMGTNLSQAECDFATALDRCFITNGVDNNRYIEADGITAVDSTTTTGYLFNSPKARLINYYRGRLYLGDYLRPNGTRERTGVAFSSQPLGIVALVSGDHTAPITSLEVSDTKYIKLGSGNDSLEVYRGNSLIGTITVTARSATTLTISSFGTSLLSADELWVPGTHDGEKKFRWDNASTGIAVREYDTFRNPSEEDLVLLTNIDTNMVIFTKNSISVFNGTSVRPLDLDIGCVSKKSFVKMLGQGVFLHYTGLYAITGPGVPRLLTAKVQQLFDNASPTTLENACAAGDEFSYFVHIGDIPFYHSNGALKKTLNNVVLEYNFRQNNIFIHTDIPMSHFAKFIQSSDKILLFAKASDADPITNYETIRVNESVTVTVS